VGSIKLPGGRRQVFATKLALQANPAKNTKLAEKPLCSLCSLRLKNQPKPAIPNDKIPKK